MNKNKNKGLKNLTRHIFVAFLIMLVLSAVFSLFNAPFEAPKQISLGELVKEINAGKVRKIDIKSNDLDIELKDGTKASTKKEVESSLSETLSNYGVDLNKMKKVDIEIKEMSSLAFWFVNLLPILLPIVLVGLIFWIMFRKASQGTMQAFSFGKSGARMAGPKEKITFANVAGLKGTKEELKEVIDFLKNPKKFLQIGAKIPRGVLLMGSPGTGKTLLARAVAGEAGVPFFHISGSEFVEMFVGVGASRVRDTFAVAKKAAPAILFIDELDAIGRHRGAGLGGGHDEREQTLNQILVEMDGFEHNTNIIVMAATNRPDVLDPALLRPGRFDRRIVLDEPDINDREAILKIHGKNKPLFSDVDMKEIAVRTPGFSGADLANLMNEAAILAARRNKNIITQAELIESIEKVMLGPARKSHLLSVKEKEIAAYHEAGHAVVAAIVPASDPVHKISIIARGGAAGYTLKLPEEERRLLAKPQFLADLAVSLGGYAAEKMIFGELTTGASNDLQKATQLARSLVTQYGMSEKLGPRTFGEKEELIFLGKEIHEKRNYSEETASKIDKEVDKFIDDAYKTAQKILKEKKDKLVEITKC